MGNDIKSKEELLTEIEELRKRVTELEAPCSSSITETSPTLVTSALLHGDHFHELRETPRPLRIGHESTESIELKSLFTRDVSASGSFDIRGGIWSTTFGKVIQALPIPSFLIDEYFHIAVANQACGRFTPAYEMIQGRAFSSIVTGASAAEDAQALLQRVFSDRKPRIAEGTVRIDDAVVWARMTFRPIRIMQERFVLLLLEDLTREKLQLGENERLRQELEKRVERRTAELRSANENLTLEVAERQKAEKELENVVAELQEALAHVKKLSGFLPICASCKKIRDDKGYWQQIEQYITEHSEALFSHGICPECAKKLYPEFASLWENRDT
jgi:PAS domain-containing protein